jgi:hypothetical protein
MTPSNIRTSIAAAILAAFGAFAASPLVPAHTRAEASSRTGARSLVGEILGAPMPTLGGEAALEHLEKRGLYRSLREAVHATTRVTSVAHGETNYPLLAQSVRLTAGLGAAEDRFGDAVAISGNTAIVGAPGNNLGGNDGQGSAHVFKRSGTTWTLEQRLELDDGAAGDSFGAAVDISGGTAIVGAPHRDVDGNADSGAAYVFTRSNDVWTLQGTLTADDGGPGDRFGYSVSVDGSTAIVGAPTGWADGPAGGARSGGAARTLPLSDGPGAAYVFVRSNGSWSQQQKLEASDAERDDQFGVSVALDMDTAVVGASRKDEIGAENAGAAYVYTQTGAIWTEEQKLLPNNSAENNFFGCAVDVGGETILVGSRADDIDTNVDQGAAFAFVRSGAVWEQQKKFMAADGQAEDNFGASVALDGDVAVIGATEDYLNGDDQGSAYVFRRSGTTWSEQNRLFAPRGTVNDEFGNSVAIDDDTIVVGASLVDVDGDSNQGSASVFMITQGLEEQDAVDPGAADIRFGYSVAISGEAAVVGAYADNSYQGSVFVYRREGEAWSLEEHLTASDAENGDSFGRSVGINGNTIVVGAYGDNIGSNDGQGSIYIYERTNGQWEYVEEMWAPDGDAGDNFGYSVAISGDRIVAGAYHDDVGQHTDQGSAYVYVRNGDDWDFEYQLDSWNDDDAIYFGVSVAICVDTIVVGAYFDGFGPNDNHGTAQVFVRDGSEWDVETILTADDVRLQDHFGISVAISGDTIVVGNGPEPVNAVPSRCSVYVFKRTSPEIWPQQQKLQNDDGEVGDGFGYSVAISGDTIVVGAFFHDVGANDLQGSAFVFTRSGEQWTRQQELVASNGEEGDAFGRSVAISGDTAIVGAFFGYSAYVFACAPCPTVNLDLTSLPDGTVGRSYSESFTADGGDGPYNFSVSSGALPPGLSVDPGTGELSGTPTTAGSFDFTVTATDDTICPGSRDYSLVIECSTITVRPGNPSLRSGTVGTPYSKTFTATGGVAPYTFSITAGALPPGLALDATTGELSGTPTVADTYSFEVTASDSGGCSGAKAYVLTIQ